MKGVKAPPFALPDTFAEGMLSPNPSVSAAAELLKYAYSLTVPKKTGSTQEVVMFTAALPFDRRDLLCADDQGEVAGKERGHRHRHHRREGRDARPGAELM